MWLVVIDSPLAVASKVWVFRALDLYVIFLALLQFLRAAFVAPE